MALKIKTAELDNIQLMIDPIFSDCIVKSEEDPEHQFKLHRNILANRSDAFKAMLTSDMKEGKSSIIELPESKEVLMKLFVLIYSGWYQGDLDTCLELCQATDKYLMLDDHKKLLRGLMKLINVGNAVQIWFFAYENEYEDLKKHALKYITLNFASIRKDESWDLFADEPDMLNIVIDAYIERMEPKEKK